MKQAFKLKIPAPPPDLVAEIECEEQAFQQELLCDQAARLRKDLKEQKQLTQRYQRAYEMLLGLSRNSRQAFGTTGHLKAAKIVDSTIQRAKAIARGKA